MAENTRMALVVEASYYRRWLKTSVEEWGGRGRRAMRDARVFRQWNWRPNRRFPYFVGISVTEESDPVSTDDDAPTPFFRVQRLVDQVKLEILKSR